jgi:hypothetical protein
VSDGIYGPLDVEPDIEWADRLERVVVRNLSVVDAYADTALQLAEGDPVSAREFLDFAKRRLERIQQLLQ